MQEFLDGEECCHNFINQDLTFLQPATVYLTTDTDDNQSIASDSTDTSILTVIENDQSQEVDSTPAFTSATALPEDFVHTDYDHPNTICRAFANTASGACNWTHCQRTKAQRGRSQPYYKELLGLSSREGHVTTPLQMLDGQYVNQPSHFLPLAQEA